MMLMLAPKISAYNIDVYEYIYIYIYSGLFLQKEIRNLKKCLCILIVLNNTIHYYHYLSLNSFIWSWYLNGTFAMFWIWCRFFELQLSSQVTELIWITFKSTKKKKKKLFTKNIFLVFYIINPVNVTVSIYFRKFYMKNGKKSSHFFHKKISKIVY